MNDLMQILFDYTLEHTHDVYCLQTDRMACRVQRDMAENKLWDKMTKEELELLEEYQRYEGEVHMQELYAMFLAAFDLSAALLQRHTA